MNRLLIYIVVMGGVTYLIRCLPLIFFRKKIQNSYIQSFLYYVPYAVLGDMIPLKWTHEINKRVSMEVGFFYGK
ncbi:AzlD domain-containing protein, partial [Faecalicoccus pleomorphus]|uniref:AzlD domain-containing protein n=1 Tax=Faecalicoccus pleomorphus TaxID=1323 RepID=UPI00232A7CAA